MKKKVKVNTTEEIYNIQYIIIEHIILKDLPIIASGQYSAHPSTNVCTILAFVLNKSSRVMPGFRGTPAGITTTSAPVNVSSNPPFPFGGQATGDGNDPDVDELVGMCDKSAATPGVPTMS